MEVGDFSKIGFFFIMLLAVSFEVFGDYFFKKWALSEDVGILNIGLFMYFVGSVFWATSLRYETLSRAILVFLLLSLIMTTALGVFIFREELTLANKFGLALAVLALILVEL